MTTQRCKQEHRHDRQTATAARCGHHLLARRQAGYWYYTHREQASRTGEIRVSGNIETTEAQVAFKIAGRVEKRLFDEGQMVHQGQEVAELDTADLKCNVESAPGGTSDCRGGAGRVKGRLAVEEKAAAKAALEKAEHALADLEAGSPAARDCRPRLPPRRPRRPR